MIAFGIGVLRLSPEAFWSLTPRELAVLAGAARPAAVRPARAGLEALMRAHPDSPPGRSPP